MLGFTLLFVLPIAWSIGSSVAHADVTFDGTLGPKEALRGPDYEIGADKGRQVGSNLFHSFGEFSLVHDESATFSGPAKIDNILARVTGGAPSEIDGTIRTTIPDANLFLMNPKGVVFGENAKLDVQGSFAATTASSIRLGEGNDAGRFEASPARQSVLTSAPPSAFGFLGPPEAGIEVRGAQLEAEDTGGITLVGGNVAVTGGGILAQRGDVRIASVAGAGEVGIAAGTLDVTSVVSLGEVRVSEGGSVEARGEPAGRIVIRAGKFVIDSAMLATATEGDGPGGGIDVEARDEMQVANGAEVRVETVGAGAGGAVAIAAPKVLLDGGRIHSVTSGPGSGGVVSVRAGVLTLAGAMPDGARSEITSETGEENVEAGAAGDVTVEAYAAELRDGAAIGSSTSGLGNAGKVEVRAGALLMSGLTSEGSSSAISSESRSEDLADAGNSGTTRVVADRLEMRDAAAIDADTSGAGNAGAVQVEAGTLVLSGLDGEGDAGFISSDSLSENAEFSGNGGDVHVRAESLELRDGAFISSNTFGTGDAGSVDVQAGRIALSGEDSNGGSVIQSISGSETLTNAGDAGSVRVKAVELELNDGATISSNTFGTGNAGSVDVQSDRITLSGMDSSGAASSIESRSISEMFPNAGNAGNVRVEAVEIELTDGAFISSGTSGTGAAGSVELKADRIALSGEDSDSVGAFIGSSSSSAGKGGRVRLQVGDLELTDGATISSTTLGTGDAGSVEILANRIALSGEDSRGVSSSIQAASGSETLANAGKAGDVRVQTVDLELLDGAFISSSTFGTGDAGSVDVKADRIALSGENSSGRASAIESASSRTLPNAGTAGSIRVEASALELIGGARIFSTTLGTGNAGSVEVKADHITLSGESSTGFISAIRSASDSGSLPNAGSAGSVRVEAGDLELTDGASISSSTFGTGDAGSVEVKADHIRLFGEDSRGFASGIVSQSNSDTLSDGGSAGDVRIEVGEIDLGGGSFISSSTRGTGDAGSVEVVADRIVLSGELSSGGSSRIQSSSLSSTLSKAGNAGSVYVQTNELVMTDGTLISSSTLGTGDAGSVEVMADRISLAGEDSRGIGSAIVSRSLSTTLSDAGKAGGVRVEAGDLELTGGAFISSSTLGTGDAGAVDVKADRIVLSGEDSRGVVSDIVSQSLSDTLPNAGNAGSVRVEAGELQLWSGASISSDTFGTGEAGSVAVVADRLALSGVSSDGFASQISSASQSGTLPDAGSAGGVRVTATSITILDGARISAETAGSGSGGDVVIASEGLIVSGINSMGAKSQITTQTDGAGNGGQLLVQTPNVEVSAGGTISARSTGTGRAGDIQISAANAFKATGGTVETSATRSLGNGGSITIDAGTIQLTHQSPITADVEQGAGSGGNVTLRAATIAALNDSDITARAREGQGGNILIDTDGLFLSPDSMLDASSDTGISGTVTLNSPEVNLIGSLVPLPETYLQASALLAERCAKALGAAYSSFVVTGPEGVPPGPDAIAPATGTVSGRAPGRDTRLPGCALEPSALDTRHVVEIGLVE